MEPLDYSLRPRWFLRLLVGDPIRDATVFSKNRDHLLAGDVAVEFMAARGDKEAQLAFASHLLTENHNRLVVCARPTPIIGTARSEGAGDSGRTGQSPDLGRG
jgi:hypothetical protein